jgi:hypothetical protein
MKKRSLFAAVAMLIVSAVVLSSATYAWFASSANITSTTITSRVANSSGGILISEQNSNYRTEVDQAAYNSQSSNFFPAKMDPVSGTFGTTAMSFNDCALQGKTFTASSAANSKNDSGVAADGWVTYTTYAKAQADGTLTLTPNFGTQSPFVYYAIFVKDSDGDIKQTTDSQPAKLLLANGDDLSYKPITSDSGTATDTTLNNIVDDSEATAGSITIASSAQTAAQTSAQTLAIGMTTDEVITITVYMWAEGQDAQCKGTVSSTEATSALAFSYAYPNS